MADGVELASAYVTLIPSLKGAQGKIASELEGATAPAGNRAGATFGQRFRNAASTPLAKIGGVLAGAFAGAKVVDFFKDSIQGASDLEQSVGGVRAVFGKYAAGVERDSARAAQALGLSQNAYNELITVSGAMLKNKGLSDFAAQSTKLVGVGADLAAQFGGSTKEAVDALNAAMRGESDPIERYGISLNEAAIKAELAATGQDKLTGAALETAKTQARLRIITQQSADAHGAFARESDTLAGKQARLSATWDNLRTKLGTKLLPVVTRITDKVGEFVQGMEDGTGAGGRFVDFLDDAQSAGKAVLGFFKSIPGPVKSFAVQAGAAAAALGLMNRGIAAVRTSSLVTGISSAIGGLRNAETRMDAVRGASYKLGGAIRNLAGAGGLLLLVDAGNRGSKAMSTLQGAAGGALAGFAVGGPVGAGIGAVAGGLLGLWRNSQKASSGVKTAAQTARDSIGQWKAYKDTLDGVTAAFTEQTREMVRSKLQKAGVLESTRKLGIADSTVVQGVAGNTKARQQLNAELNRQATALQKTVDWNNREYGAGSQLANQLNATALERLGNIDAIRREIGATDKAVDAKRRDRIITGEQSKAYQNIPQRVRTKFETPGRDLSYKGILEFGQQLKLTPKQVRTLIQTAGLPKSRGDVEKIKADLDALAKKKTEAKISANAKPARDEANRAGRHMRDVVKKPFRALIDANNRPALSASANVDRTLGGLGPYRPTIDANTGPARSAVSRVQSWINSLNTTFTLNAIFGGKRRGGGGGGGRAAGGANRVVPRVVTPAAPRAVVMPQTMILRIPDGPTLRGYVEGVADDVVGGYAQLDYQAARTV